MSRRALISVYDKTGLEVFATGLAQLGFELVASGGSAEHLRKHNLAVTTVEEVTEVPEMLGGAVKTLHPTIHAGILAPRERPDDVPPLAEPQIAPLPLVSVHSYPFANA